MAQTLLTTLLVGGSALYVLWTLLLPAAARRRIAAALLQLRWPGFVAKRLQAQMNAKTGCSCETCGNLPPQSTPQPVHWAPRRKL